MSLPHKVYAENTYIKPHTITKFARENFRHPMPGRHNNKACGFRILRPPYKPEETTTIAPPLLFVLFNGNLAIKNEFIEVVMLFKYDDYYDTFNGIIRPNVPPTRTSFIRTGIFRDEIDNSPIFETVHDNIIEWLTRLQQLYNFDWKTILPITYSNSNFKQWLTQLRERDMPLPIWMLRWCDLRKSLAIKFTDGKMHGLTPGRAAQLCEIPQFMRNISETLLLTYLADHVHVTANEFFRIQQPYGVRCF